MFRLGDTVMISAHGTRKEALVILASENGRSLLVAFDGGLFWPSDEGGYAGVMPLYAVVTREYFGERAIGTAYGGVFLISCIGMGLGSYAGGIIHDLLGTYLWLFLGSGAVATMAIVLALTLRAPRRVLRPA